MPVLPSVTRTTAAALLSLFTVGFAAAQDIQPAEMLRGFLLNLAGEQLSKRREAVAALKSTRDIEQRQAYVRSTFLNLLGGLPESRTPLNLRRTGTLDRGDYRVEKIIFESLPRFYMTGNLYIPKIGTPPFPAVLQPVGHSQNGKAAALYQSLSISLVKNGFVVLTYDPVGQGERMIFYNRDLRGSLVGPSTVEHQMIGTQSLLGGQSVARYRVWDGMRALDVLESLNEVDKTRLGIAGCSGGGTLTTYILALDQRIKAAAPACYISAWEEQLKGTGPQDAEQQFPDQLLAGINHGDYLIAFAPKPLFICSTTEDFFPLEGSTRTLVEMRRIYEALGAPEKIDRFVGPGGHGMRRETREAIVAWMNRWMNRSSTAPVTEPEHKVEADEDLYATETGQVATSLQGETASTWNIKTLSAIRSTRPPASLIDSIVKLTRFRKTDASLNVRTLSKVQGDSYQLETLVYDAEPGRYVPATLCMPAARRSDLQAVLYADARGRTTGFAENGDARELCVSGHTVLAIDLAGNGETVSVKSGEYSDWFGAENLTWMALMVGRTMVGMRSSDIVRGVDLLAARGLAGADGVAGFAKGTAGVSLLHAAVLDPRLSHLVIEDHLVSWRAIAETPIHRRVFDVVVPGVLAAYDFDDLVAALAPRPVTLLNVRSPLGDMMLLDDARKHYQSALGAYPSAGEAFRLRHRSPGVPAHTLFSRGS